MLRRLEYALSTLEKPLMNGGYGDDFAISRPKVWKILHFENFRLEN
jgi:hypothetical protein